MAEFGIGTVGAANADVRAPGVDPRQEATRLFEEALARAEMRSQAAPAPTKPGLIDRVGGALDTMATRTEALVAGLGESTKSSPRVSTQRLGGPAERPMDATSADTESSISPALREMRKLYADAATASAMQQAAKSSSSTLNKLLSAT